MFELAIAFSNFTRQDCTPSNLIQLFAKNGVFFSEAGSKVGFDTQFTFNNQYIFLEENKLCDTVKELCDKEGKDHNFIFPSDENFNNVLWNEVKEIQNEIRNFFDYLIENNRINNEYIKAFIKEHPIKITYFAETEDGWQPDLDMEFDNSSLKNYIISHDIIWPIYKREGHEFERIRQCPECGKYFYAADIRKQYCDSKCRFNYHYKLKKSQN